MQQYHENMHFFSCCLSTGAQYVQCFHHCPLTSGISRVTHKDRLSRERTHAAALFDQVIKKCMPCLNISGFLFFVFIFLCTILHSSGSGFYSFHRYNSTVFQTVLPCRILAEKLVLTSQAVNLLKVSLLLYPVLLIYPTSFTIYRLKVLICI